MADTPNRQSGRRTSRLPIAVDVLKNRISALGISHQAIVNQSDDAGTYVGISSIRGAITDGKASPKTIKAFALALKLPTAVFVADSDQHRGVLDAIDALLPTQARQRIHTQDRILHPRDPIHCVQDKKNIIRSPRLSRALIKGIGVPSLFDAVYNSATFTPLDDDHKDRPFVPGMSYNHYLMIAAVLIVNHPREKSAIGYHRAISHLKGTYKHTQGLSILWATGFEFNLKETMDRDMWNWMNLASQSPHEAEAAFIGKDDPALLRLLSHKLTLNPSICTITPLCVITNDQRPSGKPRVYTQYVFSIEVTPRGQPRPINQLISEYIQSPDQPAAVAFQADMHTQFVNHKGQTNHMDVAAWEHIHQRAPRPIGNTISVTKYAIH